MASVSPPLTIKRERESTGELAAAPRGVVERERGLEGVTQVGGVSYVGSGLWPVFTLHTT